MNQAELDREKIEAYLYQLEKEYEGLLSTRMASGLEYEVPVLIERIRQLFEELNRTKEQASRLMRQATSAQSELDTLKREVIKDKKQQQEAVAVQ